MQFLTVIFTLTPPFLVPAALYTEVDPFVVTIPILFPVSWHSVPLVKMLIFCIRTYLSTICFMEACRFYAIQFLTVLQVLEFKLRCVKLVFMYTFPFRETRFYGFTLFKWYHECQVANRISTDALCSLLATFMGDGFFIFLRCNIASFKCQVIIPLQVYWLMPTVSFACAIIHYYFLHLIIQVRTLCEKYLHARKRQLFVFCYTPGGDNIAANGFCLWPVF